MRKRIVVQAALALTTIVLTIVMVFAMTAAWYTNVVHTNGLTFEVEAWGFNGEIVSNLVPIVAGPGDSGVIDLEVASNSDSPSAVSVSFSKIQMPTEMQKRIFFYVDTQMVRNDETMERVYLNSQESYTYNLFSQGKLTLTEAVHNDAQLKWHWVYDVLGYYVQGNLVTLSDGLNTKTVAVNEYLRPIEYDYDKATMKYVTDAEGNITMVLETVDGTLTPEEFLVEFSKTDGYTGEINPKNVLETGYYPVEVDDEGNGVYAYLCSYSDIQKNTAYDTALGQGTLKDDQRPYTAKLMVSAQKSKTTAINVSTFDGLSTAVGLGAADVIELTSNVTIGDQALTIPAGQDVMVDLNGNKIITTDPDTVPIVVQEGGSLTMVDGSLVYQNETASATYAMQVTGAEVVLSNVDLSGYERGLRVADNSSERDSSVRLIGCEWTTNDTALLVYGNGSDSVQKTQIIVENSKLHSNDITICGNGNAGSSTDGGNYGTDIQIINSTVTSDPTKMFSAIYQPQKDSVLTIYNSTISGYTGVAIKGGTVNIIGSVIKGEGAGMAAVDTFGVSGFNDTGDAVYIETNYPYEIELNISDLVTGTGDSAVTKQSELTSSYQYALRVHDPKATNVKVNIVSGSFNNVPDPAKFLTYIDSGSVGTADGTDYVVTQKAAESGDDTAG